MREDQRGQRAARLQRALYFADIVARHPDYQDRLEKARDAILITGAGLDIPGPTIQFANSAFERLTGFRRAEILGRTPRLLQGTRTDPAELRRMREGLIEHGAFEGEVINYRKDKSEYLMGWAIAGVPTPDGKVIKWLSVQNDVNQDLRAEREWRTRLLAERESVDVLP